MFVPKQGYKEFIHFVATWDEVVPDATQSDDSSQVDSSTQKSTDYAVNSAGMETEGDAPVLSDAMSFYQSRWQKEQEEEQPPGEEITDDRDN